MGWKRRVKDFKFGTNKKFINEVFMQHVFMNKELYINLASCNLPLNRPNCEYLTIIVQIQILVYLRFKIFYV